MSLSEIDWKNVEQLEGAALKSKVFSIIQEASCAIQSLATDDPSLLAVVPRVAKLIDEHADLKGFREIHSSLARAVGLWNYIDTEAADQRDRYIAASANVEQLGISLHKEQIVALNSLLNGHNLILSAPTSFGKSVLIDALILSGKYRRLAIVLPTIALLDEFRRRLSSRFRADYDIIMHQAEVPKRDRVIFLGTQERLINRSDLGRLDLVVVDEFYKLDPSRRDDRSITLNAAVYRLLSYAEQFFFLGPNIDNVVMSSDKRWSFEFLQTRFSTVAVDTFDLRKVADKKQRLIEEAFSASNWPALVFVSSPDHANSLATHLAECKKNVGSGEVLSQWMVENYGDRWSLCAAVAAGIGVHHGRVPKALASKFIKLFNDGDLPILLCTSTLIEGVNTAARSVLIFDKTINGRGYDFFTFSNIKGRAGRLGQHHVGQVYLFHTPPGFEDVDVESPLFGDWEEAPDEYVVHIEDSDSTPTIDTRIEDLSTRSGLDVADLRRFSGIGIETLIEVRTMVANRLARGIHLDWNNWPDYDQIEAVCEVVTHIRSAQKMGAASYKQLALYISELRSQPTLKSFFHWHNENYRGDPEKLDNIFKFLRAAEYNLPEYFAVVELMVKLAGYKVSYALFLAQMPRWFRQDPLKMLEEQGVPIQISERFINATDTLSSLSARLVSLAKQADRRMSAFERQWVLEALPDSP
ncbi:DEAD/DEAH box helicase [Brucella sp. BE17]|uniref:DEAD/DEAH box helicase n=1 Tax=Brucella sp. BE17 TaxID=3142977 RepID=UPI0031BB64AC